MSCSLAVHITRSQQFRNQCDNDRLVLVLEKGCQHLAIILKSISYLLLSFSNEVKKSFSLVA